MSKKYTKEKLLKMPAIEIYKMVLRNEISRFPMGFWEQPESLENAKIYTKFMIEEVLNWNDRDIKEKLSTKIFIENKLRGMLDIIFDSSPYDVINTVYPNRFKQWELKSVPLNFWTLKTGIEATKWLIEEKLKWTNEDIKEKMLAKTFRENNLNGMLQYVFNNSSYNAINSVYPGRFKEWDFKNTRRDFWTLENGIKATKWLIEQELKWDEKDIKEKISQKVFKENNLSGMLGIVFNSSPYTAINAIYPNRFKQWEFNNVPIGFWTLETGVQAAKWMIEEKLNWNEEDIKEKLSQKVFKENNLSGMFQIVFNSSSYGVINSVYPNKFKKEDLKSYQYKVIKNK